MNVLTLDADGRIIEQSVTGGSSGTTPVSATNNTGSTIAANSLVNIFDNSGVLEMRLADSSASNNYPGFGFTVAAVTNGTAGDIQTYGPMEGFTGLTIASKYWSDPATPGDITPSCPFGTSNQKAQLVGRALSTTSLFITISEPIKRL